MQKADLDLAATIRIIQGVTREPRSCATPHMTLRVRGYVPTSTKAFGARERTVVHVNSMWTQPSWPLSCPVAQSAQRHSWLMTHSPASLVSTARPLGTHGMLSSTMMAPGRQPPASIRPRPRAPLTMLVRRDSNLRLYDNSSFTLGGTARATLLSPSGDPRVFGSHHCSATASTRTALRTSSMA